MNDLILFMAGGIWVFVMACLFAFIEHLKNKLKEKKQHDQKEYTNFGQE